MMMVKRCSSLLFLIFFTAVAFAQRNGEVDGEALFRTNCSPCHGIGKEKAGPSLASITKKKPREWLIPFIKNSQKMIAAGDKDALNLFENYKHSVMPSFRLSDKEIEAILLYIEKASLLPSPDYNIKGEAEDITRIHKPDKGRGLFNAHCGTCHSLGQEGYGPALASVTKRRSRDWIIHFVWNSDSVIKTGDPYANFIYNHFDKKRMPEFKYLDTATILSILDYIEYQSASPSYVAGVNGRKKHSLILPNNAMPGLNKNVKETKMQRNDHRKLFFKIFLAVVFSIGAIVYTLIVFRFYKYLSNN